MNHERSLEAAPGLEPGNKGFADPAPLHPSEQRTLALPRASCQSELWLPLAGKGGFGALVGTISGTVLGSHPLRLIGGASGRLTPSHLQREGITVALIERRAAK